MELGLRADQPWLVLNGAVNVWNYYIQFLNGQHMCAVEGAFKAVLQRLFRMDKTTVDPVRQRRRNRYATYIDKNCLIVLFSAMLIDFLSIIITEFRQKLIIYH
jgi:hypothetical protein